MVSEYVKLSAKALEEPITEEMLSLLETNLAKESLKAFMEKGGEIYLFADWTR